MSLTSRGGSLHGGRRPRLELLPPSAYTFGPEACELSQRAGLILDPWQQDSVNAMLSVGADNLWACPQFGEIVPRQNGKGAVLEARVLAGLFLLGERLIMWSAHQYKTALEAFMRVRDLIRELERAGVIEPGSVKTINTNGEEGFELAATGARLKFIARSNFSGRGFSGDVNIIDEAFAYTRKQQAALQPTMSARPNAQTVYTSTPPLSGEEGEVMYLLRKAAEDGVQLLGWRDWGLPGELEALDKIVLPGRTEPVDLSDRALWELTNPALGIRISERSVQSELDMMDPVDFARERLGIWPRVSRDAKVISLARWGELVDPASTRGSTRIAVACDVSPLRDYAAVAVWGERADGAGHLALVDYQAGTKWIVPRLKELRASLSPLAFAMGRATAVSLANELKAARIAPPEDPEKPRKGDLHVTNVAEMAGATAQFLDAVTEGSFRYLPHRQLDQAVKGAKTKASGDGLAWSRQDLDTDITPLVASTLARWAFERCATALDGADYDLLNSVW